MTRFQKFLRSMTFHPFGSFGLPTPIRDNYEPDEIDTEIPYTTQKFFVTDFFRAKTTSGKFFFLRKDALVSIQEVTSLEEGFVWELTIKGPEGDNKIVHLEASFDSIVSLLGGYPNIYTLNQVICAQKT